MSNGNDMAFPVVLETTRTPNDSEQLGLTKREYFAAMAMQSFARLVPACPAVTTQEAGWIAQYSVMCADALLAELAKQ